MGLLQSVAKFFFKWPMQACQIIFSENLLYWGPILRFFSISTLMNTNLKLNKKPKLVVEVLRLCTLVLEKLE